MRSVDIGGISVGDGHPVAFVAEVGTFFNRDMGLAHAYLEATAAAGAHLFKTEILHDPDVCLRDSGLRIEYAHAAGTKVEDYRALIERKVVPLSDYRKLFASCQELGVPFMATVYDPVGVDFLVEVGGAAIKIARDNINNVPLIRRAARTGLPMVFDAGVVYFEEVAKAVELARESGAAGVVVNHHPGSNPAPPEAHNMSVMATYKEALGVPVGLACHYRGDEMLYLAVGMGANLLEKGVVDDPDRVEQDLVSALSLDDLPNVIRKVTACWQAIGNAPADPREPRDLSTRKGLVTTRAIAAGEALGEENIGYAWPPVGIPVDQWDTVDGARAAHAMQAREVLRWEDLERGGAA